MNFSLEQLLHALIGSFFGALGFAGLVHVPKKAVLPSGFIAALTYLLYWALEWLGISDPMAIFIGALFGSLAGQWLARRMKMIGTIFLMAAIVPVVPGLGLYRMMSFLGQGLTGAGAREGIQAMITIAMTALGLGMGSFLDRVFHHKLTRE